VLGHLLYVQLGSPRPEALAGFYRDVFGMTVRRCATDWICQGPECCVVLSEGSAGSLLSAGYAAVEPQDVEDLAARTAAYRVAGDAIGAELFQPGAVAFRDPDRNRISYGVPFATQSALLNEAAAPARLQHVVVGSTHASHIAAFYADVAGLRKSDEVFDEQGNMRTCFLRTDEEHHSFAVFQTSQNRLDHHCYELPDWNSMRDWGDRLAALHVAVKWGPGRHGPGNNLFMFFHDLDGNWVELSTELEVVEPARPVGVWPHEERTLNTWGRAYLRT